ncbi:hypothetical protein G7054_g7762 [Neopestalotiopsis clavispora]|nr:hypothetical protein G7054_g7762 [Neopestalotiopsis clavispora]
MSEATPPQSASKRQACVPCHVRKVKCDATEIGFPCSNCQSASREDCRLHLKRKRTSAKLPGRGAEPVRLPAVVASSDSSTRARTTTTSPQGSACSPRTTTTTTPRPVPKVEVANLLNVDESSVDNSEYLFQRHLAEFIDQPHLTERPIDRYARTMYVGTDVSNLSFLVRQQFGKKVENVSHFPTDRIARRHTCHDPDRLPLEAFQLPEKGIVDRLLRAYFTHINPGFPVVDETIFMKQYESKDPDNPPSLLLLHAILLVGAHVCFDQPNREHLKATFFRRAKSLFDARFERNRDTIVQAALLLTWHADGPEDVVANAWYWLGIAARTATGMGMHRDAENSTLVPHVKRMWRRVWWLLFQCDTLVSLQYGRPPAIHLADSDVQRLQPSDFRDCGPRVRADASASGPRRGPPGHAEADRRGPGDLGPSPPDLPAAAPRAPPRLVGGQPAAGVQHSADTPPPHPIVPRVVVLAGAAARRGLGHLQDGGRRGAGPVPVPVREERNQVPLDVQHQLPVHGADRAERRGAPVEPRPGHIRAAATVLHFFENSVKLQEKPESMSATNNGPVAAEEISKPSEYGVSQGPADVAVDEASEDTQAREAASDESGVERSLRTEPLDSNLENGNQNESRNMDQAVETRNYAQEEFESWSDWRHAYWQQPEFESEFLFTF